MVETIKELQNAELSLTFGRLKGLDRREDCEKIVAVAQSGGRDTVGCIILGRGEDDESNGMVEDGGGGSGIYQVRYRPNGLLAAVGELAGQEDLAGKSS